MSQYVIQIRGYTKPWKDTERVFSTKEEAEQKVKELMVSPPGQRRAAIFRLRPEENTQ